MFGMSLLMIFKWLKIFILIWHPEFSSSLLNSALKLPYVLLMLVLEVQFDNFRPKELVFVLCWTETQRQLV